MELGPRGAITVDPRQAEATGGRAPTSAPPRPGWPRGWRYRAPAVIRPTWRHADQAVFVGLGLLFVGIGGPWWIGLVFLIMAALMEYQAWRSAVTLELVGPTVTARGEYRTWTFPAHELVRVKASDNRGVKLELADGRKIPILRSGALGPFLRLLPPPGPAIDDRLRRGLEKSERVDEKAATRRDRHPWVRPAFVAGAFGGLALMLTALVLTVAEQHRVEDRAVGVAAPVLAVTTDEEDDGDVIVTVRYEAEGRIQTAMVEAPAGDAPAVGATFLVAVDPEHPDVAWTPGRTPDVGGPLGLLLVGAALSTLAFAVLAPTAFAEHPVLERV